MRQHKGLSADAAFRICILATITLIIITRVLTIAHNMFLHPDEYVYFFSTKGIINFLSGDTLDYTTSKPYPEGAFVFQAPFQMIFRLFSLKDIPGLQLSGRVASVYYFTVGVVLGFLLFRQCFGRDLRAAVLYGITMVFSVFHLEQSRYGTSDALIFMFLMLELLLTSRVYNRRGNRIVQLIFAGMSCGVLASMKYPLLYFCLLPVIAAIRFSDGAWKKVLAALMVLVSVACGFFLASPKTLFDIDYINQVISIEWKAYMTGGNLSEFGGWYNHLLAVPIYMICYAGLLGGPLLACPLFRCGSGEKGGVRSFWRIDMPLVFLGFFAYNMFTATVFMRAMYPLACVIDIYACAGLSAMLGASAGQRRRWIPIALVALTVLRGGCYIGLMMDNSASARFEAAVQAAVDDSWEQTTILGPGRYYHLLQNRGTLKNVREIDIDDSAYSAPEALVVKPGELVITSTLDHSKCSPYILPIDSVAANRQIERWAKFKAINSEFLRYQAYPQWYYYAFGFWIRGTTSTDYEFPTNYIYYRPAGS